MFMQLKKILSFIFAGVILFNTCGDFFLFRYRQFVAKHEMKEMIHSGCSLRGSIIVKVVSPENNTDFKWLEPGEFSYRGKMFDVVSEKISGKTHYFTCLNDRSEESLISNYTRCQTLASHMGSPDKSRHQQVLLQLLIKHALIKTQVNPYSGVSVQVVFPEPVTGRSSLHFPPFSPPPRVS